MADESNELAKQATELDGRTSTDNAVTAAKALVSAVPIVGGVIASLMSDLIKDSQERRLLEFTKKVADELTRHNQRLNADFVKTEDFAHLWQLSFRKVSEERGQQKLEAYKNILVNSLILDVDTATIDEYVDVASRLGDIDLRVLSAFVSDASNQPAVGQLQNFPQGSLMQTLRALLPELDEGKIDRAILVLDGAGITNKVQQSLMTGMTGHGATQLESRLTAFGRSFVDFVLAI